MVSMHIPSLAVGRHREQHLSPEEPGQTARQYTGDNSDTLYMHACHERKHVTHHYQWYIQLQEGPETATESKDEEQPSNDTEEDGRGCQKVVSRQIVQVSLWRCEHIHSSSQ